MRLHKPAVLQEVLELLDIKQGHTIIDGTVGHGGHAAALLQAAGEKGTLIAFDWDLDMLKTAEERLQTIPGHKIFIKSNFREIPAWVQSNHPTGIDAILLDLGVNLAHFDDPKRGFSFSTNAPLDMRMDRSTQETAAAWLNRASEGEIAYALKIYGGERWAGPIAKRIVERRKTFGMKTTQDLIDSVIKAVPASKREKRIHPATRTFQAIRIVINHELDGLQTAIENIADSLKPGGRMAVLSYHSGEDRAVKHAFRKLVQSKQFEVLTKKPLVPSPEEIRQNPHSRSAKLRVLKKLEATT
jgi:16S rRNA (cytosine1402-N4)-methyltransferase